jgi:surfeit locus 1 family protein
VTAALAAAFVSLGVWQLHRAEEKQLFFAAFEHGRPADVPTVAVADDEAETARFRGLRLRGHYDGAHQILLDARVSNDQAGYEVLTPFTFVGGAILVNRGWVIASPDRNRLPDVAITDDDREISGRINMLPTPAWRSSPGAAGTDSTWPRRLLFPTAAEISAAVGYPLHNYQLLLGPREPDGYLRDWQPAVMRPEQHLAYAVQWFALALTLIVVYVVVNLKRTP